MSKCQFCGKEIDNAALVCPYCEGNLNVSQDALTAANYNVPVTARQIWKLLGVGLVTMMLLFPLLDHFDKIAHDPSKQPKRPSVVSATPPAPAEDTHLQATVSFDGSQFEIANIGSVDWTNVKFDLNGGLIRSGYVLRPGGLNAGQVYTVGAMQFTDSNGTRFNPFQLKPLQMAITATLPTGSVGVRIVSF